MIDTAHALPVRRQAELLLISRSNVYYLPRTTPQADLVMMRRIDELHLNYPFAGARMLRDMLKLQGFEVGRKHIATLMAKMRPSMGARSLPSLPAAAAAGGA